MKNKNCGLWDWMPFVLIILFGLALFFQPSPKILEKNNSIQKLNLNEKVQEKVMPDEVIVTFSIITRDNNSKKAIDKNTELNNRLMDVFKKYKVQTTRYQLNTDRYWNKTSEKYEIKGYVVYDTFTVTANASDAGKLVNIGVKNGANNVESVIYVLSQAKKQKIMDGLMTQAITNAKNKAQKIAKVSGLRILKILEITPSEYQPFTYRTYDFKANEFAIESANPKFKPEEQTVTYTVNMIFEVE